MNICVTGACGYIGSSLIAQLQKLSDVDMIYAFDNLIYNQGPNIYHVMSGSKVVFYNEDVTGWSKKLIYAIQDSDVIVPLAALVGAPICGKRFNSAMITNFTWFGTLMEKIKTQLILYPNTNSGYGTTGSEICTEETPIVPLSHYAKTKQWTEELLLKEYDNVICFRLATVFGTSYRNRLDLLVNNLTYRAVKENHIEIFDGDFRRNYIHVDDICRAFIMGFRGMFEKGQVYNLGNDSINMSKRMLAETISRTTGTKWTENFEKWITDADKRDYIVSSEKIMSRGFEPTRNLEYGIRQIMDFCKYLSKDESQMESMYNYR